MRSDSLFSDAVHLFSADLYFELMSAFADDGGVERLVAVSARDGDEVLDAAGHGTPQRMNQAEYGVAGGKVVRDDANGEQVVDLIEGDFGALQFLKDGEVALDAPFNACIDVVFPQLLVECVLNPAQELLALDALGFDGLGDFLEADGIGVAESEVFQFTADFAHPEAMGERCVDVEGLARNSFAAVGLQVLKRAHVVQAISEFDEDNPDVGDHGQKHFADIFRLTVFAVGELDLVDLGDTLDNVGDLVAEIGLDLLTGGRGVLNRVVQQTGGDSRRVHLHFSEHFRHFERVDDVRLTRRTHLALVMLDAKLPGLANKSNVFSGSIDLDEAEKGFDATIDGSLVDDGADRPGGRGRFPGGAVNLCRCGLADCRHASL